MPRIEAKHPSVAALLKAHPSERYPKRIIKRLAKEKVAYGKSLGWAGPPFCPLEFCSLFRIRCFEVGYDIGGDGRIILNPDGSAKIEYACGRMPERQRFTIFHEFAHTLFPDFCRFVPLNDASPLPMTKAEREFEHLCDLGAAEMLFPEEEFRAELQCLDRLDFAAVGRLRGLFHASIDATCHRLANLVNTTALSVAFLSDQRGDRRGRGPLWVNNSAKNDLFRGFIPPGTGVPEGSVAVHCYADGGPVVGPGKETWWIGGKPRTYLVQAAKLPNIDNPAYPKVVVLLLPSSYRGGPGFASIDG